MKKGDIYEIFLDPVIGSEQAGRRPAVIISGNLANKHLNTVIVCPLTSQLKNYRGNLILEPSEENGLSKTSEVMTVHICSVSKERIVKKLGTLEVEDLDVIEEALSKILKY